MKICSFLLLFITLTGNTYAQSEAVLEMMSQGLHPGRLVTVEEISPKQCEKYWRSYLTERGSKPRKDRKTKEWVAENVRVAGDNMLIYSKVEGKGDRATVVAWFSSSEAFVGDGGTADDPAPQTFMDRFAHFVAIEEQRAEVEKREKEFKKLETAMTKLERDRKHYDDEIERAKERIQLMEDNIVKNTSAQETMAEQLATQRETVEAAKERLGELRKQQQ